MITTTYPPSSPPSLAPQSSSPYNLVASALDASLSPLKATTSTLATSLSLENSCATTLAASLFVVTMTTYSSICPYKWTTSTHAISLSPTTYRWSYRVWSHSHQSRSLSNAIASSRAYKSPPLCHTRWPYSSPRVWQNINSTKNIKYQGNEIKLKRKPYTFGGPQDWAQEAPYSCWIFSSMGMDFSQDCTSMILAKLKMEKWEDEGSIYRKLEGEMEGKYWKLMKGLDLLRMWCMDQRVWLISIV